MQCRLKHFSFSLSGYRPCSLWEARELLRNSSWTKKNSKTIGIPLTLKKKRVQMPAARRLPDDRGSSTNSAPVSERRPTRIDKVKIAMKFSADVKAAGLYFPLKRWLGDYKEKGFHPGLIPRAEEIFKAHPDLLMAFKTFFPDGGKCTVPE